MKISAHGRILIVSHGAIYYVSNPYIVTDADVGTNLTVQLGTSY